MKTVWILGSGFSKGIGAPMLYELLSEKGQMLAREVFPETPATRDVYQLFQLYGPASKGAKYWEHAEDFLDLMDAAIETPTSPRRKFLQQLVGRVDPQVSLEDFRDLAILAIATEVNAYVEIGSLKSEAWQPYINWAKRLTRDDSIITFNYDTLLEKLGNENLVRNLKDSGVVLPRATTVPENCCPIFKLHGSAEWALDMNASHRFRVMPTGGFHFKDGYRPLIGTPGATKQNQVDTHFEEIWNQAMARLQHAEAIVFVGYRFPPSDSHARRKLLHYIGENKTTYLRLHTVLGPHVSDTPTVRLNALLKETLGNSRNCVSEHVAGGLGNLPRYLVTNHPLYAEDFMSVINDQTLVREPRDPR